jgi:hypothetical protein
VTAPAGGPALFRLAEVAAWDVAALRGAVGTFDAAEARLRSWRARLDGVGRALASGESWTGSSARSARGIADGLSSAAWAVEGAAVESLGALQRLVRDADRAQELALRALALSSAMDAIGGQLPVPSASSSLAAQALAYAAAAGAAAEDAGTAFAHLGAGDAVLPADLSQLLGVVHLEPAVLPTERPPDEVAAWWAGLSATAQRAAIRRSADAVGGLDGVPAWARDRANRLVLDRALDDPGIPESEAETARAVAEQLRAEEEAGRPAQLHLLDLAGDRVVLVLGDLDTADAVALLVPGMENTPADDLGRLTADARDVASSARAADPGLAVATVAWLGYRTPDWRTVLGRGPASRGAPGLAAGLAGLEAARTATGGTASRTTVLAHSYGTVVVDEAADLPGDLAADALVLSGSPGMEGTAAGLEAPEVYDATADDDWAANLGWHGSSPGAESYGSTGLPTHAGMGHSHYYSPGFPTLDAIGEVIAGVRRPS